MAKVLPPEELKSLCYLSHCQQKIKVERDKLEEVRASKTDDIKKKNKREY